MMRYKLVNYGGGNMPEDVELICAKIAERSLRFLIREPPVPYNVFSDPLQTYLNQPPEKE